jgi:hypothetical protein
MPGKTRVDGNRVTIDDLVYEVHPAGESYYKISDEFGQVLGYIRVRGKVIVPEDYGLEGAPPVKEIGRLWGAANLTTGQPAALASKGVCQITTHETPSEEALVGARAHRAWLKKQPGIKASYLVRDPATGKAMSITICQTRAQLDAAQGAASAEGVPLKAASVEVFPFVEEP